MVEENEEQVNYDRIRGVRNRYLEHLRRTFEEWGRETGQSMVFIKPKITGRCSICSSTLTEDFPKDYPDEFKFCCSCFGWIGLITAVKTDKWLKHLLDTNPTIKKIYKRITVFG